MSGRTRVRLVAVVVLLIGLAFVQDPGYLVGDTKFDLAVSPGEFLQRALHLWDDRGAFGQLQNQAYGYLWPMGPFFTLFHALDVPGWVVQRLWQALVLCVAFLGAARVTRALGARSDVTVVVAGLAYALSPRMLTVLGPISIEAWPSALAPWVLLPLVLGSTSGSPRRAAALSALAVAMVGGVNAAATFAVLPLGAVWLLTRRRGPRRTALMVWWPVFTLLGTLWWLVPLFVMGAYSPPFLDFIETTAVTTFPTTVFDILRGTSDWVPYVSPDSRAGNDLLVTGYLALNSGVVLSVGVAGLLMRRNPHRLFLALGLLVGLLMVGAGHVGAVQGLFAEPLKALLDGPLAPLRNVHKFDPVVRLPLVLGLAHVVDRAVVALAASSGTLRPDDVQGRLERVNRLVLVGVVMMCVAGSTVPALRGRIESTSPVVAVPQYWQDAASWLSRRGTGGTALLAPGTSFGTYVWGSPRDEPLQFLTPSSWAVRNAIPLTPTGNIRLLDAVEDRLVQGHGSRGLVSTLRRSGVGFLVVRNDLRPGSDVPDPVMVHQAIADSPGLERAATFGPEVGGKPVLYRGKARTLVNAGWQSSWPAIEVFRVPGTGLSASGGPPTVVAGGPEDLLDLSDLGVLGEGPVVLGPDVAATPSLRPGLTGWVLTDGLRRRERFFARLHDGASAATTPGDVRRTLSPARDLLERGQDAWSTTVRLVGAQAVSASSSASDADATGGSRRGELPYAALDGSDETSWVSGGTEDGPPWWEVRLASSVDPGEVTIVGGADADDNQRVRVRTARGVTSEQTVGPGERVVVDLPDGAPRWIRVESAGAGRRALSLAEVGWPGRDVRRQLVLPTPPRSWGDPAVVVLRSDTDARRGCAQVGGQVRCVAGRERADEEPLGMDRRFSLRRGSTYESRLLVRPRSGPALAGLVAAGRFVDITTSTVGTPDPRGAAWAAIDGDPGTTWTAAPGDFRPAVALSWLGRRAIRGLTVVTAREVAARRPTEVALSWPGGRRVVRLDERGRATFPAVRTRRLTVQVREAEFATSLGFDAQQTQLPVGISELRLDGLPALPAPPSTTAVDRGCGSGPTLDVDGTERRTAVTASAAQLLSGVDLPARICPPGASTAVADGARLQLAAGPHDVSLRGSGAFQALSLVLSDVDESLALSSASTAPTHRDSPVRRTVRPNPGSSIVDLGQNYNPGWAATQSDKTLSPVVLDGWRQGWVLRSNAPVVAEFAPDSTYRWGLGVGLLALVGLVVVLVLPWTRGGARAPAVGQAVVSASLTLPLALLASLLVAGWPGLAVLAVVTVLVTVLRRRSDPVGVWVLASTCFAASLAYWVRPWADAAGWAGSSAWPDYLALAPVLACVVLSAGRGPRLLHRIRGASSQR